jgi:hypothetical protein
MDSIAAASKRCAETKFRLVNEDGERDARRAPSIAREAAPTASHLIRQRASRTREPTACRAARFGAFRFAPRPRLGIGMP